MLSTNKEDAMQYRVTRLIKWLSIDQWNEQDEWWENCQTWEMDKLQLWSAVEWVCLGDQAHLKTMFEFFLFLHNLMRSVQSELLIGGKWKERECRALLGRESRTLFVLRSVADTSAGVGSGDAASTQWEVISTFDRVLGSFFFTTQDLKVTLVKIIVIEEGCSMLQRVSCYIQVLTECEALVVTWPDH